MDSISPRQNRFASIFFFLLNCFPLSTASSSPPPSSSKPMSEPYKQIGGGDINEKKRKSQSAVKELVEEAYPTSFNPLKRSHLMHAVEGLNRYPNYLSRWADDEITQLEKSLTESLNQVRKQKQDTQEKRQALKRLVDQVWTSEPLYQNLLKIPESWQQVKDEILHPSASKEIFRSKSFVVNKNNTSVPTVQDVIAGECQVELNTGYLQELMEEEMYDVYSFPLLAPSFCSNVQHFIKRIIKELDENPEFASLNRSMIRDLDNLGLKWLNDLLFHLILRPISRHLYIETEMKGGDLDWRQGYIAAYSASPTDSKPRQRLVPHTDDSEVTLNVCIGEKFQGGRLQFWGLRGTPEAGTLLGNYCPEIGRALIHSGRHFHEVTEITKGNRFAYILWARSWSGVRAETCPCCWLNRRDNDQSSCICGPTWN